MKSNEMEFIDELAVQLTEKEFGEETYAYSNEVGKEDVLMYQEDAHNYYNEKYDEIETLYQNLIVPKINPLDWFNHFVDYMQEQDPDMYNKACEYADYEEKQSINLK
jgi:hypothetical protein